MKSFALIAMCILFPITALSESELRLDSVPLGNNSGQCGCWYYYPAVNGTKGKLLARGEAAESGIYINLNGVIEFIGNWKATYYKNRHFTDYSNKSVSVSIESKILREGRYSNEYSSLITLKKNNKVKEIKAFGSCGC